MSTSTGNGWGRGEMGVACPAPRPRVPRGRRERGNARSARRACENILLLRAPGKPPSAGKPRRAVSEPSAYSSLPAIPPGAYPASAPATGSLNSRDDEWPQDFSPPRSISRRGSLVPDNFSMSPGLLNPAVPHRIEIVDSAGAVAFARGVSTRALPVGHSESGNRDNKCDLVGSAVR